MPCKFNSLYPRPRPRRKQ